ncbi:MAG: sugar transferase [Clostridiales bacterium]|nr:sugar transferase [Clostridiales bacterium]
MKRTGDILLSGLAILLLSPLMLALGVAVRLTSPGPAFFLQKRVGRGKQFFTMYKFRTMRTDTPSETPTHLLKDPHTYITGIGRLLRKTSLDELPQLWNILKGDMSIVGPRPALWNQDDLIAERDRYGANEVRPGLTGLAQVRGRDELPIEVKAAYDGEYCAGIGFVLDCWILWRTCVSVVTGRGIREGGPTTPLAQGIGTAAEQAHKPSAKRIREDNDVGSSLGD